MASARSCSTVSGGGRVLKKRPISQTKKEGKGKKSSLKIDSSPCHGANGRGSAQLAQDGEKKKRNTDKPGIVREMDRLHNHKVVPVHQGRLRIVLLLGQTPLGSSGLASRVLPLHPLPLHSPEHAGQRLRPRLLGQLLALLLSSSTPLQHLLVLRHQAPEQRVVRMDPLQEPKRRLALLPVPDHLSKRVPVHGHVLRRQSNGLQRRHRHGLGQLPTKKGAARADPTEEQPGQQHQQQHRRHRHRDDPRRHCPHQPRSFPQPLLLLPLPPSGA